MCSVRKYFFFGSMYLNENIFCFLLYGSFDIFPNGETREERVRKFSVPSSMEFSLRFILFEFLFAEISKDSLCSVRKYLFFGSMFLTRFFYSSWYGNFGNFSNGNTHEDRVRKFFVLSSMEFPLSLILSEFLLAEVSKNP